MMRQILDRAARELVAAVLNEVRHQADGFADSDAAAVEVAVEDAAAVYGVTL